LPSSVLYHPSFFFSHYSIILFFLPRFCLLLALWNDFAVLFHRGEILAHEGLIPFAEPLCELRALERAPASGRETGLLTLIFPSFHHSLFSSDFLFWSSYDLNGFNGFHDFNGIIPSCRLFIFLELLILAVAVRIAGFGLESALLIVLM
jgi:hypothetical protein